jgi:hypothetical protein
MLTGRRDNMLRAWPHVGDNGWRKSSYSLSNGECVEVSAAGDMVAVRDSKNLDEGKPLVCLTTDWRAFITAVKKNAA